MTNLTERLRYCGKELADRYSHAAIFDEAADEIERLRTKTNAEIVRLKDEIERLRADGGEPVAWRCIADDGVSDVTEVEGVADQWRSDGFAVAPLYAAPRQAGKRRAASRRRPTASGG